MYATLQPPELFEAYKRIIPDDIVFVVISLLVILQIE